MPTPDVPPQTWNVSTFRNAIHGDDGALRTLDAATQAIVLRVRKILYPTKCAAVEEYGHDALPGETKEVDGV